MKASASKDLVYEIADEIGPDVSYFRFKGPASEERLYLTGIEIAAFLGTVVLGSFCKGFIKGYSEGLGMEMGKQAAKETAGHIISRLEGVINKMRHVDTIDVKSVNDEVQASQAELDEVIVNEIPKIISKGTMSKTLEITHEYQIQEVVSCLKDSGFPSEIASSRSERIVVVIREEWPLS